MERELFNWMLNLIRIFSEFSQWLTSPIDKSLPAFTPLTIFGLSGLSVIIGLKVFRLVIGG